MIDEKFLITAVENLITAFNETYTENKMFEDNKLFKNNIIVTFKQLLAEKKVTKEHETEIHARLLKAISNKTEAKAIGSQGEAYVKEILEYYGDEMGGYLLYCNKALGEICIHERDEFEKHMK